MNMSTTYMNVNFNKVLETLIFSTVLCAVFILNTLPINRLSKAGAALVNTTSSLNSGKACFCLFMSFSRHKENVTKEAP